MSTHTIQWGVINVVYVLALKEVRYSSTL